MAKIFICFFSFPFLFAGRWGGSRDNNIKYSWWHNYAGVPEDWWHFNNSTYRLSKCKYGSQSQPFFVAHSRAKPFFSSGRRRHQPRYKFNLNAVPASDVDQNVRPESRWIKVLSEQALLFFGAEPILFDSLSTSAGMKTKKKITKRKRKTFRNCFYRFCNNPDIKQGAAKKSPRGFVREARNMCFDVTSSDRYANTHRDGRNKKKTKEVKLN